MKTIKQSICWWCFVPGKMSADEFLGAVAEAGYDAVELAPKEYWPMIKDHGLAIATTGAHASIADGLNRRENFDRIAGEVRASLDDAVNWRIPCLICFSGNRAGLDDTTGAEVTAEALRKLAPDAEQAGVTLVVELLNSKRDHPDYQCDTTPWGARVVDAVSSPRVKLLYDVYHMQIMEGDIIATIQANHASIGHYHTAGNPGRNDLDAEQELYYPPIFRAIAATGYDGYIGHEFIPKADPAEAIRAAHELCRKSIAP
ncbi:MAG: xylose isomerase [Spirochaetaceae bacterium]|nr:MAG: xylose isomerase [Spirochaetaceae bacterium]